MAKRNHNGPKTRIEAALTAAVNSQASSARKLALDLRYSQGLESGQRSYFRWLWPVEMIVPNK